MRARPADAEPVQRGDAHRTREVAVRPAAAALVADVEAEMSRMLNLSPAQLRTLVRYQIYD
jgi:hypothetical protein